MNIYSASRGADVSAEGIDSALAELQREVEEAGPQRRADVLARIARDARVTIVRTIARARLGHIGGDLSVIDILTTLYFGILRVCPQNPSWPDRDRFILSKGHCAVAFYTVLARAGFIPRELLDQFARPLSPLNGHPARHKVPGVEANTGALGHGLPFAVGCALAAKMEGSARRIFVVLGDGELQEGSNWEAAMMAGHHRLTNLTAIVDRNGLQQGARTEATNQLEPLTEKWRAFGWDVIEVDGHDHAALLEAIELPRSGYPRCIVARTVKGKGVSFMEGGAEWHHKVPTAVQVEAAVQELCR
ncbi:transketolase [Sorangium sp. So ce1389]|uniref:transketolase n=1 Tax=Sorangium sp. So ce1389 TaxID=3133336 RepID=UPI003F635465